MNMHYELNEKHDFDTFDSMSIDGDFSQYRKVKVSIKTKIFKNCIQQLLCIRGNRYEQD